MAGLVVLWACVVIAAGHGIAPLGLMPYFAFSSAAPMGWRLAPVAGVFGALLLVGGRALSLRWLFVAGSALLLVAWYLGVRETESWVVTGVTSVPYLWLTWSHARRLVLGEVE